MFQTIAAATENVWATKSEGVGLIVHEISFKDFRPICGHDPPTSWTDGQTDGQTTCDRKTALCTIYGASRGNERRPRDVRYMTERTARV